MGFEPTIPVFERAKTVHALGGAATVIDYTVEQGSFNDDITTDTLQGFIKWDTMFIPTQMFK
jgi:hypothetical protein